MSSSSTTLSPRTRPARDLGHGRVQVDVVGPAPVGDAGEHPAGPAAVAVRPPRAAERELRSDLARPPQCLRVGRGARAVKDRGQCGLLVGCRRPAAAGGGSGFARTVPCSTYHRNCPAGAGSAPVGQGGMGGWRPPIRGVTGGQGEWGAGAPHAGDQSPGGDHSVEQQGGFRQCLGCAAQRRQAARVGVAPPAALPGAGYRRVGLDRSSTG